MKALIAVVVNFITGALAFFAGRSSGINKTKATYESGARKAENVGYEAGIDGVEQEQRNQEKPIETKKHDHFES